MLCFHLQSSSVLHVLSCDRVQISTWTYWTHLVGNYVHVTGTPWIILRLWWRSASYMLSNHVVSFCPWSCPYARLHSSPFDKQADDWSDLCQLCWFPSESVYNQTLEKKIAFFFSLKNPSKWISWLNKQFDCLLCWATWRTDLGMELIGWQSLCILLNTPLKCSWISLCATHTPYIIQHRIVKPPLCLTWQWTNQPSKPNGVSNNFEENYVRKKKTCGITLTLQIQWASGNIFWLAEQFGVVLYTDVSGSASHKI